MSVIDSAKEWLFSIALKKGIVSLAKLLIAWFAANGIAFAGTIGGLVINTNDLLVTTAVLNSLLKMLTNYLKVKFPKQFGWL